MSDRGRARRSNDDDVAARNHEVLLQTFVDLIEDEVLPFINKALQSSNQISRRIGPFRIVGSDQGVRLTFGNQDPTNGGVLVVLLNNSLKRFGHLKVAVVGSEQRRWDNPTKLRMQNLSSSLAEYKRQHPGCFFAVLVSR